jgi:hypothetical protein
MLLAAKASSEDGPRYFEILQMSKTKIEEWFQAMEIELAGLLSKQTFTVINRDSVP